MPVALAIVLAGLLAGLVVHADESWRAADPRYQISLPRDHASHPDARIEWWYYTGHLTAADGRRFGYQLTFFRVGIDRAPRNPSRWTVRDLHMAHFAVTDLDARRHVYADRLNRAGVGWAGASPDRFRVWNEDWEVRLDGSGHHLLRARHEHVAVELELIPGKPAVLHGEAGYSRKGPSPGNASHYYSLTRMPSRGTLTIDGTATSVRGESWMDHEWGTSFLEPGQAGWDWFSLQLDDGRELMLFQIRRSDGAADPFASATIVGRDGSARHLAAGEFSLRPGRTWTSPASGARYPVAWDVAIPSESMTLTVTTRVEAQELHTRESTAVTYWEGAVEAAGSSVGRPTRGRGYLEMTGYTGRPMSDVLK